MAEKDTRKDKEQTSADRSTEALTPKDEAKIKQAPIEDVQPEPGAPNVSTGRATGGVPDTDAGDQFGERPTPIPAEYAERVERREEARALPRHDVGVVQQVPVVTGVRLVEERATPEPEASAKTASANRIGTIGPLGLKELARLTYGDESRAIDIFDANRDRLVSPDSTVVGTVVRLPD